MNDLYRSNPWAAMSGHWPKMDSIGPAKVTHWNDGHYGLLVFEKQPTSLFRQEFLRDHLPGWVIYDDRIRDQVAFRTCNSDWTPLLVPETFRPKPRKLRFLVQCADNPARYLGRGVGGAVDWLEEAEAEESHTAEEACDWRDAVIPCRNPSNGIIAVREYR
jgi:hypothetical protein